MYSASDERNLHGIKSTQIVETADIPPNTLVSRRAIEDAFMLRITMSSVHCDSPFHSTV